MACATPALATISRTPPRAVRRIRRSRKPAWEAGRVGLEMVMICPGPSVSRREGDQRSLRRRKAQITTDWVQRLRIRDVHIVPVLEREPDAGAGRVDGRGRTDRVEVLGVADV